MKLKSIFLVAVAIIMASCSSGVPNKSIFKSLSSKEIARGVKVDSTFKDFYDGITEIMFLIPDAAKERYENLTYKNTFEAYCIDNDINKLSKHFKDWDKEWEKTYGKDHEKIDSVLNYWDEYAKQNSPDKFVKVELVDLSKSWSSIHAKFKITALKETLESVKFTFSFSEKTGSKEKVNINCSEYYYRGINPSESGGYSKYIDSDYLKSLSDVSLEGFLQQYDYSIFIKQANTKDRIYGENDNNIPYAIQLYRENTDSSAVYRIKERIINELIDGDYVSKEEFRSDKADEWVHDKYPQEMEFLDEIR